jgi:putative toxin-antitoxin system antitoxin component (TIGR02293 family)
MTAAATVEHFLGTARARGNRSRTPTDWEALIERGMPVRSMEALKDGLSITDGQLAQLLGISEKTLSRARAAGKALDPVASDRLFRVARVAALAIQVLESERAALRWLKREQVGLGGRVPLAMLATDPGRDQVEKLLLRVEHGVYT